MDDAARAAGPTAAARTTADLHRPTDRPAAGGRPRPDRRLACRHRPGRTTMTACSRCQRSSPWFRVCGAAAAAAACTRGAGCGRWPPHPTWSSAETAPGGPPGPVGEDDGESGGSTERERDAAVLRWLSELAGDGRATPGSAGAGRPKRRAGTTPPGDHGGAGRGRRVPRLPDGAGQRGGPIRRDGRAGRLVMPCVSHGGRAGRGAEPRTAARGRSVRLPGRRST